MISIATVGAYFWGNVCELTNLTIGPIQLNNEAMVHRILSFNISGRDDVFREGIRSRDGKCVISGVVNRSAPYRWSMFEAAHIFPLEKESLWSEWGFEVDNRHGQHNWSLEDQFGSEWVSAPSKYSPIIRSVFDISQSGREFTMIIILTTCSLLAIGRL